MVAKVGDRARCLCGSGQMLRDCCGRFLLRERQPATAEQLMRSRYCAYVQANSIYLRDSWHPSTRPAELMLDQLPVPQWLGLKIVRTSGGGAYDAQGEVEFVARYKLGGKAFRLHEISRFVKEQGCWYYVAGEVLSH